MQEITTPLWEFHRQKERGRMMKAKMNAIKSEYALKKKNKEMEERIAREEQEDREAKEKGELPKKMQNLMRKYAKA